MGERFTYPLWMCLSERSQAQFIQTVWDEFGIDLIKEDTIPGIESLEEIDEIMKQEPLWNGMGR